MLPFAVFLTLVAPIPKLPLRAKGTLIQWAPDFLPLADMPIFPTLIKENMALLQETCFPCPERAENSLINP